MILASWWVDVGGAFLPASAVSQLPLLAPEGDMGSQLQAVGRVLGRIKLRESGRT